MSESWFPGTPGQPLTFAQTMGAVGCGILWAAAVIVILFVVGSWLIAPPLPEIPR